MTRYRSYMTRNRNRNSSGGVSFLGLLQLLFIGLKLTNQITWSWVWVLSPIWISISLTILLLLIFLAFALYIERK